MSNAARIAALNDAFRANPSLGTFVLTAGILTDMPQDILQFLTKCGLLRISTKAMIRMVNTISGLLILRARRFSGRLITMTAILNLPRRMLPTRWLPIAF